MGGRAVGDVQYAKQGDVYLAYRVLGEGPRDLLLMSTWFVPIDAMIDGPTMSRALDRLSSMGRLIIFDRRGIGLSDPISPQSPPTLEQWMGDALAVLNEVGSDTATVRPDRRHHRPSRQDLPQSQGRAATTSVGNR
jgi:pimeloyl-ACP methyl ester carboxylesterase